MVLDNNQTGLSTRVADMRLHVRVKALNTLNVVLRKYGSLFSPQTWSVIFKGERSFANLRSKKSNLWNVLYYSFRSQESCFQSSTPQRQVLIHTYIYTVLHNYNT